MSSEDYFNDSENVDSAFFDALDAIEATHIVSQMKHPSPRPAVYVSNSSHSTALPSTSKQTVVQARPIASDRRPPAGTAKFQPDPIDVDADDSYDQFMDELDIVELEAIDRAVEAASKPASDVPHLQAGSSFTRQVDLFGRVVEDPLPRHLRPQTQSKQASRPFGKKAQKVKKRDHTAFAKSGWTKTKSSKSKGKIAATTRDADEDIEDFEQSADEFEQFPAPLRKSTSILRNNVHLSN
jgi:ATP-dependent DNA helicase MPH1